MNIGNKIKQLRQKCGYTQEKLAESLGVSAQSISKWENSVTMPDITLLPLLAEQFGVSIDELFDLTTEERLRRIRNRMENEAELSSDVFREYEEFLTAELDKSDEKYDFISTLAHLYHHRMESDSKRASKYARDAIMMCPEKKDCQWILNKAEGQVAWDWNVGNHAAVIDFYKKVIESDTVEPKTPLPYYYLIDNLIADNRLEEAKGYVDEIASMPSHNPILVPTYRAYIALGELDFTKASAVIEEGLSSYGDNGGYLFEVAQYYAARADYERALDFYERSWKCEEKSKPRFTDTLEGIAAIYGILGDREKEVETYDRIILNLKEEWNYSEDDLPVIEVENKKRRVLSDQNR